MNQTRKLDITFISLLMFNSPKIQLPLSLSLVLSSQRSSKLFPGFRRVIDEVFDSRAGKMNYAGGKIKAGNHFISQNNLFTVPPTTATEEGQ